MGLTPKGGRSDGSCLAWRFLALAWLACSVTTALGQEGNSDELPLYLGLDTPPAPELSPEEALQAFATAPGFSVELAAAEPLVEDPVAIAWDEFGNLYIAQMRGFMPDLYGTNQTNPVGMVVRLLDEDADGVYDLREVLLDKLVLPRAVAIVNEGLLIAEPPNLWLCPNSDGSARSIDCEQKILLGEYGNQPGSVEHAENGLVAGLDNWLYSAKSGRRLRLRDRVLESEPTLFRGQWGISKDNAGRLYYNSNSILLLADAYDAQQVVKAGMKQAPGLSERISAGVQLHAIRVNTGVNRAYVPGVLREDGRLAGPTSASGMAVYRGDQFGSEFGEDVFVAEPAANVVAQLRLHRQGLEIGTEHLVYADQKWRQREFLASTDERFRPVDVKVGPDGALYVVDLYRGVIQDHVFITEELRAQARARGLDRPLGKGRIWRVWANERPRNPVKPTLTSTEEQFERLGHRNGWQRDTAQRLLIGAQSDGLDQVLIGKTRGANGLAAVHALWVLKGRGVLARETVLEALRHADSRVRLAALEAGAPMLSAEELLGLAKTTMEAAFAQHLTLSMAAHNSRSDVVDYLVSRLIQDPQDALTRTSVQVATLGHEMEFMRRLLDQGHWNADLEEATRFFESLAGQGFRSASASGGVWLDLISEQSDVQGWVKRSLLLGLFKVTWDEDFERTLLAEPHPIFASEDETLWPAISLARRAFTWPGDELSARAKPLTLSQAANRELGAAYYASRCATCHGESGSGIPSLGPPLTGSPRVAGPAEVLARIVLHGMQGPLQASGVDWNAIMPGHDVMPDLSDEVAAGLVTFLRRSWGHAQRAVDAPFIAQVRAETSSRLQPWTLAELEEIPTNLHYSMYEGRFGAGGLVLEFDHQGRSLEIRSGVFNGTLQEQSEDHFLFAARQLNLEFVLDDHGEVTGVRMQTPEGGLQLQRLQE